jgi:WD40 repeat protein
LKSHDSIASLTDARFLMQIYLVPIRSSALHVYHSAVVTMPRCNLGAQASQVNVGRLLSARDQQWSARSLTLEGHTGGINCVTFSPDGSQIISGSYDDTVQVWDAVSGKHKHTLKGHTGSINSVAFSPDGLQIISGSQDYTVRVWDVIMSSGPENTLVGSTGSMISGAGSSESGGLQATLLARTQFVRVRKFLGSQGHDRHSSSDVPRFHLLFDHLASRDSGSHGKVSSAWKLLRS